MTMMYSIMYGMMAYLFSFGIVGAFLSASFWAVGAYSSNYTQSYNGKRSFYLNAGAVLLSAPIVLFNLSCFDWANSTLAAAAIFALARLVRLNKASFSAQFKFMDRRESLIIWVAASFIPRSCRSIWVDETISTLHEAESIVERKAWLVDAARKAPWLGLQLIYPGPTSRAVTIYQSALGFKDPHTAEDNFKKLARNVLTSHWGYALASVAPCLTCAGVFFICAGWLEVLQNLENISVVGIATQSLLAWLRRKSAGR